MKSSSSILFYIQFDILKWYQFSIQALESQMFFEHYWVLEVRKFKTRHAPRGRKLWRLTRKRCWRLAIRNAFSSHSNEMRKAPFKRLQLHQTSTSCTSSENIVIPSNGSSFPFKRTIAIRSKSSLELSVRKQSPTLTVLSCIQKRKIQILKNAPVEMWLHGSIIFFNQSN